MFYEYQDKIRSVRNFLEEILYRPKNETAFLVLPVEFSIELSYVPDLTRKNMEEMAVFYK